MGIVFDDDKMYIVYCDLEIFIVSIYVKDSGLWKKVSVVFVNLIIVLLFIGYMEFKISNWLKWIMNLSFSDVGVLMLV